MATTASTIHNTLRSLASAGELVGTGAAAGRFNAAGTTGIAGAGITGGGPGATGTGAPETARSSAQAPQLPTVGCRAVGAIPADGGADGGGPAGDTPDTAPGPGIAPVAGSDPVGMTPGIAPVPGNDPVAIGPEPTPPNPRAENVWVGE